MARVLDCRCGHQVIAENDQVLYFACREHLARAHPGTRVTEGEVRSLLIEGAYTAGDPVDPHGAALVRRVFREVWERGDIAAARECFTADYVNHDPMLPEVPPGYEGVMENVATYRRAFPDRRFSLHEIVTAGDRVVVRFSVTGTHTGRLGDIPPTSRTVTVGGIWLFRLEDGKIGESWGYWDTLGLLQQVGAVTTRPAGAPA